MNERSQRAATHKPYEDRAHRILDAAATLLLRHGYDQMTIEDIAREAGVGKGTLYLHWKSREALFTALITREKIAMAEDLKQRIANDPEGSTLRGLLRHSALALMSRPILRAALLRDTHVFGKLIHREQSSALSTDVLAGFTAYLQALREQGLMRTDLPLRMELGIFGSIFMGFLLAAPLLPDAFAPSDEELAAMMAETGHRTLEPHTSAPPHALHAASRALTQYLDHSMASAYDQLDGNTRTVIEGDRLATPMPTRARGRNGGRSKKLKTAEQVAAARRMYADKTKSIEEVCSALGISRASLYRYVREAQES